MTSIIRAAFFLEQHLGHQTYYQNLRHALEECPSVDARWVEVSYQNPASIFSRLPIPSKKIQGTLIGREQVISGLSAQPYDVAFFNTQVPAALAPAKVKQKPYLLSTDITPIQYDLVAKEYDHAVDRVKLLGQMKHRINTALFQSASYLLPWSKWAGESLRRDYQVDPAQVVVIPPGVDLEIWKPVVRERNRRFRILFVGGDFWRKGGEFLLDIYRQIPQHLVELIIVTRSQIQSSEGITVYQNMRPNTPELVALYQSCDAFVFPTQAEAFGIAAIEAAAAGLPVVASNVSALPDIVIEGSTGFLPQRGDLGGFCKSIQTLIEQPGLREQMGAAAHEHVLAHFSARKNAQQIQGLMIQAAGDRRKGG